MSIKSFVDRILFFNQIKHIKIIRQENGKNDMRTIKFRDLTRMWNAIWSDSINLFEQNSFNFDREEKIEITWKCTRCITESVYTLNEILREVCKKYSPKKVVGINIFYDSAKTLEGRNLFKEQTKKGKIILFLSVYLVDN